MIEDVAYQIRTPEFWNACVGRLRRERLPHGRLVLRRQGPAGPVIAGLARLEHGALQRHQRHQHRPQPRLSARRRPQHEHLHRRASQGILDKVVALSKADECTAQLTGTSTATSASRSTTSPPAASSSDTSLAVQVAFGKRVGIATINEFDDAALERVVRRAEDLARLAPENPEFMPAIGKQSYKPSPTFSESTAAITPEYRAQVAADSIAPCRAEKLVAAGFLTTARASSPSPTARATSATSRRPTSTTPAPCAPRTAAVRAGSAATSRTSRSSTPTTTSASRMRKATGSADAKALEPGKYTVILEPAAAAGLISFMMIFFDARQADEGRSFLSKKGGGNKLGEQVFDPRVNISADPWDPDAPVLPWDGEGLPREKMAIIENGKVATCSTRATGRKKQGKRAVGEPGNLIMAGGTSPPRAGRHAEGHPGHAHLVHPHGRSADRAADRPDPRRHLLHRERRDQAPGEELPLQRIAGDHAQQHRGARQAGARAGDES